MKKIIALIFTILISTELTASDVVIESRIDGDFNGWDGETIVKLTNGQIWQQVEYHYTYHYAFMPDVIIYETSNGWEMKVDGVSSSIWCSEIKVKNDLVT